MTSLAKRAATWHNNSASLLERVRLRPISTLANFWMLNLETTKCGALGGWSFEGWSPEGWEGPKFRAVFPSSATIFFLLSLSWGPFVEFWWCLKRRGPSNVHVWRPGLVGPPGSHDSPRAQMCTFQGSGLQKHQQNSTKGPQERERRMKIVAGGGKKRAKFWVVWWRVVRWRVVQRRVVQRRGVHGRGGPAEGSIGNAVQGSGFRFQFRFLGTKTETEQKQNEERDE